MTKEHIKKFVEEIERLGFNLTPEAQEYFNELKASINNAEISEKGLKIMVFMQNNIDSFNNMFSAKNIGEGIELSPKSVSSSMRKLVNDEYVEKIKSNVMMYSLTEKGKNLKIEDLKENKNEEEC